MPTVLSKDGFKVRIYNNDHLPAHVHVFKAEGEIKIDIGNGKEDPTPIWVEKMSDRDVRRALELVTEHKLKLLEEWRKIHD